MNLIILTIRNSRRNHKRVRMHHPKWMSVRILSLIWIKNLGRDWYEWDSSHENKPVSWTEVLYRRLFFLVWYTVLITNMYYIFEIILLARISYIYLSMNKVSSFKPPRWTQAIFLMIFIAELSWWPLKNWYLLLFIRSKVSNQVRSSSIETFLVCHISYVTYVTIQTQNEEKTVYVTSHLEYTVCSSNSFLSNCSWVWLYKLKIERLHKPLYWSILQTLK